MVRFRHAKKFLKGKCMRKCYWKMACVKVFVIAVLAHTTKAFKIENRSILEKGDHHHHHGKMRVFVILLILVHIYFARKVGKQA